MEAEGGRRKIAKKIFSPPREAPKRKKNQRKDSDSKIPTQVIDLEETKQAEEETNHQSNAINYVFKLKYQLQATKQKLKAEEERFKHLIKSISAHFGSRDENFSEMLRSAHLFGADNTEEIKADSGFEKLFTTHKYIISDGTHQKINENHLEPAAHKPKAKKTKDSVAKTTEIPNLSAESIIASHNEKSNSKTKKKRSESIHDDGEEPEKKKKRKKNPGKPEKENNDVEIPQLAQESLEAQDEHLDKIRQAEDAINMYQEFAHRPQVFTNKVMEDSLNFLAQQNPEQARLLHQQLYGDMNNLMGMNSRIPGMELIDQNKLMEELMKMGIQGGPMLRGMVPPEFYQMNNKK